MAKQLWVGLDVALDTTSICVIDGDGTILREAVCPTIARLVHREIVSLGCRRLGRVGLEAGIGSGLARELKELGYAVELYEARQLSKFLRVRRNKTDAGDALGIAHAGRIASPLVSRVYLKSIECEALACRLKIRRHLNKVRVNAVDLIRKQFLLFGVRIATGSPATFNARVEKEIGKTFGRTPDALAADLRHLLGYIEELRIYKRGLDHELTRLALGNDACRRMMAIPGVGPICALTFYVAVGEPKRFRKASDIGPYFGLTPTLHQSGAARRSGRISRMGNPAGARLARSGEHPLHAIVRSAISAQDLDSRDRGAPREGQVTRGLGTETRDDHDRHLEERYDVRPSIDGGPKLELTLSESGPRPF